MRVKKLPQVPRGRLRDLDILRDLMLGGRHSRQTIARYGVSLPTADRWIKHLCIIPGVKLVRESKTTWVEFSATSALALRLTQEKNHGKTTRPRVKPLRPSSVNAGGAEGTLGTRRRETSRTRPN